MRTVCTGQSIHQITSGAMAVAIQKMTAKDGREVEFCDDTVIGSGTMKDVYFTTDKNHVVAFYRHALDEASYARVEMITGRYKERIFGNPQRDYWKNLFCWPECIVEWKGRVGLVMPVYRSQFFFQYGSINQDFLKIKGREKQGKWFASARNRYHFLDPRERGDWLSYLRICLLIARAVRRLHAAGLAHSDLSYKNVIVSPVTGNVSIIDIDGLVVPGKYPPDVVGTPDFIAPEVVATSPLPKDDPAKIFPSIATDRHALAVLIYQYLLLRHPLRGDKVHDLNPQKDEALAMGERAQFIEHPSDASNRINPASLEDRELPWKDTEKLPYRLTGPYLSALFERAFVTGLHEPRLRPTADEWEAALIKTIDLVQPCQNTACEQKWYVFDNTKAPQCPFCGTPYRGQLPIIHLFSPRGEDGTYLTDNHRLMVYSNQSLFPWHTNRLLQPNERLAPEHKSRKGYFVQHENQWYLVNERLPDLINGQTKEALPLGSQIKLHEGLTLLTGREAGDRLFQIQIVSGLGASGKQ